MFFVFFLYKAQDWMREISVQEPFVTGPDETESISLYKAKLQKPEIEIN